MAHSKKKAKNLSIPSDSKNNSKKAVCLPVKDHLIIWNFRYLFMDGDFGFHSDNMDSRTSEKLFRFFHDYSEKTWNEVKTETRNTSKHNPSKHHNIPFDKINKSVLNLLESRFNDELYEYDGLFSFHVDSRLRIWGIKAEDVFFVLFCDKNHQIYKVDKH